ncbi:MAG: hypothetical protein PVJ18_17660 [Desulfobacterales bacterium]
MTEVRGQMTEVRELAAGLWLLASGCWQLTECRFFVAGSEPVAISQKRVAVF